MSYIREALQGIGQLPSPNVVQNLVIGRDFVYARFHMPVQSKESLLLPFDADKVDESPMYILKDRVYGTLEDLVLDESYTDDPILQEYAQKAFNGQIRLKSVVPCDNAIEVAVALDEGATGEQLGFGNMFEGGVPYYSRYSLQPEHYEWDAQAKDYFQELESRLGRVSSSEEPIEEEVVEEPVVEETVEEPVVEEVQEEVSSSRKRTPEDMNAIRAYKTMYASAIDTILSNYALMFTAAYQLKRPYGIATIENGKPNIVTIKGTSREYTSMDGILMHGPLIRQTINASGLKICETRNAWDIAELVLTGRTSDGKETASASDRLYFPNKMLEFAYGLETPKETEGGRTNYPRHSDAESWDKYSKVVKKSLEQVFEVLVISVVRNKKAEGIDDIASPEIRNTIDTSIERIKQAFLTCVMVAEVVQIGGILGLLKLKILDPYGLDISQNIATNVAYEAYSMQDSTKAVSRNVVTDPSSPYYSVHTFEGDSKMVNAMPLFAFKAATSLKQAGRPITYAQMILGIDTNDNILQNGSGKVNMTPKITHYTIARSRAGKGVEGLSKLANAIKSGKPVFYLDNKPDMASMVMELCREAFAVNGGDYAPPSEEQGLNIQGFFTPEQYMSWGKPELIPSFLHARGSGIFDSGHPSKLADIYYLRAVLLIMSIIDARVRIPSVAEMDLFKDVNGEDSGLVAFFDEFNNVNSGIRSMLDSAYKKEFASMNYYLNEKKIAQARLTEEDEKKIPKQTQTKPSPAAYWATTLIDKLIISADRVSKGKNAGYGNGENAKTDIYIIGQELPDIVDSSTNLNQYYPERMATVNKAKRDTLKSDYYPLAPLVAPFGQDILVGYSDDNYLNQHRGFAKDKLNAQNRMFAYVNEFNMTSRQKILTGDETFAQTVPVYYKPFLILPDHDYNKYYVKNSMAFLNSAGLNIEEVIEQNAEVDENGNPIYGEPYEINLMGKGTARIESGVKLNSAVGLKGYLNFIGVRDEEIYANLKRSGDIANEFMRLIGYNGTWREFVMDLRPEYIFSIDDINESITTGVPLANVTTNSSAEFYYVYKELFTTSSAYDPEATVEEGESTRNGLIFDLAEESQELDELFKPTGSDYANEQNVAPEDSDEIFKQDGLMDDIDLNKEQDTYDNAKAVEFSNMERLRDLTFDQILNLPDAEKALIYKQLAEALKDEPVLEKPNDLEFGYGKLGVVHDESGRAYKVDTSQVDLTGSDYDEIVLDEHMTAMGGNTPEISYSALVKTVTEKAVATAKTQGGFRSISVVGGSLIVNNTMIGLRIAEELLKGLPSTVADDIRSGRLAGYFNWKLLPRSGVITLKVDSTKFVFSSISEGMGYGANFNVQELFEDVRSLQKFVVGSKSYDRMDIKEFGYGTQDEFYRPRRSEQAYRLSQAWLHQRRINTWQRSVDTWKRKDLGTFRKTLYSGANLVGAGLATGTQATGWAGRKLFRGIGKAARDFKDLIDESNKISKM